MNKLKKIKNIHILLLILGGAFVALSVFHNNIWFDESYSVAIARHSFSEIWQIGGNDVHPILYYFVLHVLNLIFGNNILVYRLFSALTVILLAVVGYTHIRKDFGEKVGFLFSFLILFLPVSALYAGEIRMYTLGMLLGTLMAIYAYRIYKGKITKTTYLWFGLSSVLVAYTHYYGLMLAGIVNILLFIWLIKNRKEKVQELKKFIITAILQIIIYVPWLICFLTQLGNVSKGFWISLTFPGTLIEVITTQFMGNLSQNVGLIFAIVFIAYIFFLAIKQKKEDKKPANWCIRMYIGIIAVALLISLAMHSVILLYRYLLILSGLLIFAFAFFMAKDTKKWRLMSVCSIILILSLVSNIKIIKENYSTNNRECVTYIENYIQEGDIIVYSNAINGAVITTEISQKLENKSYFYNKEHWGVQEAYKAFGPYMEIKDTLEEILSNYQGRIWLVESGSTSSLLQEIDEKYEIEKIEEKQFKMNYKNYSYTIELIEKK